MKLTKINKLTAYLRKIRADLDELKDNQDRLHQKITELEHALSVPKTVGNKLPAGQRFADNHSLDSFYLELENNFRGSEEEIRERQKTHLPLYKKSKVNFKKYPAIDLGAGRGEFVDLLNKNKVRAIGIDLNEAMVKRMKQKGYEAVQADALGYLAKYKSSSLGAINGFHLAEHLPFDQLLTLIGEAYRTLVKGGFLLLETPNPENLTVGAFTFHYDPSHLKPIPPAIMDFMAKFKGFNKVEILSLQPELTDAEIKKATKDKHLQNMMHRLYGPRDYALLAYK